MTEGTTLAESNQRLNLEHNWISVSTLEHVRAGACSEVKYSGILVKFGNVPNAKFGTSSAYKMLFIARIQGP